MAVAALVDDAVTALLDAVAAVRDTVAPVGLEAARLAALAHASAELRGVFLRDLAAADPAAHGARNAADLLVQAAGVPVWQARRDAATAARLRLVPGLAEQVAGGGLELDAALLLVRAWTALPARLQDEPLAAALVALAQLVDLRDLRGKVEELLGALAPDVTDGDLADARDKAELRIRRVGAVAHYEATSDLLTAEFIEQVLHARAEADRTPDAAGAPDPRTGPQRAMAALVSLLHATAGTDLVPGESRLVVVTTPDDLARTYDLQPDRVAPDDALELLFDGTDLQPPAGEGAARSPGTARWTTRSRGGVPVGPRTLGALLCTSLFARLHLDAAGHPVDSSPDARQLNRAGRRALEHRSGYRCQRTGCGRPAQACVPHHAVPYALGGLTVLSNMVLLCVSCHHLLHDRDQPLLLTDGRRLGPRGWLSGAPPGGPPL